MFIFGRIGGYGLARIKESDSESISRVGISRCKDYDGDRIAKSVGSCVDELGGIDRYVRKGDRVLLKANLLIARTRDKYVTTDPEVVRAVIRLVKKAGGIPVIGDGPAMGSAEKVAAKCGIGEVARAERVDIINFNRPVDVDNRSGATFKKFKIDRAVLESDVVINLPKLKTHGQMTLTLGVKNMFGVIPGTRKSQWHLAAGTDRLNFARMLVDLYHKVSPSLTVMDGVIAMHGNGPQNGVPKKVGLILASEDAVALDTLICEVVGLRKERMPTLLAAEEMGIGRTNMNKIVVAGEQLDDSRVGDFIFPETSELMNFLPQPLRAPFRNWLTTRPVLDKNRCQVCLVCMENCPAKVITRRNDTMVFDLKGCIRCFCCQEMCPHGAITVGSGPLAKLLRL
ncbi:MAG: DUF362 domain-containing protein [Candidatus Abyssobacteria bacterium SURF_5]|uniref:DUF362 domain-containing protein n=1 Tax=Abyssobacteria bacterium (strain SURF_5) TaxID=2093360 RepID=A0A3A4ND84_ABYX5|nr:MAG: DUF362 domain-containing protein [Candidatus Abyssubacteria bacterium SURF_5]